MEGDLVLQDDAFHHGVHPERSRGGAEVNRYRFPGNNPIGLVDPSGLQGQCGQGGQACGRGQRRGGEAVVLSRLGPAG